MALKVCEDHDNVAVVIQREYLKSPVCPFCDALNRIAELENQVETLQSDLDSFRD